MIIFVAVFLYTGVVHSMASHSVRANLRLSFFNVVLIESTVNLNEFKQIKKQPGAFIPICLSYYTTNGKLYALTKIKK